MPEKRLYRRVISFLGRVKKAVKAKCAAEGNSLFCGTVLYDSIPPFRKAEN